MSNPQSSGTGLTVLGKLISAVLVLALVGFGVWMVLNKNKPAGQGASGGWGTTNNGSGGGTAARGGAPAKATSFDTKELEETQTSIPKLDPPGTYTPQNNIVDVELSNYAGYSGLIAA